MNIKRIAALLAAAAVMCIGMTSPVSAENSADTSVEATTEATFKESEEMTSEDSNWTYKIITNEETGESYASLESYIGSETEVSIPAEVDGNKVTHLGTYTFYENTTITKIIIPETLTDFGDFSFFACTSLSEFEVAENNELYTTVDDGVLIGKDGLLFICYPPAKPDTEYTIPDGVVALNPAAFATCTNLKTVNFPETLERMGLYCFAECTSLNNVVIPESVSALSDFNFTGCTSLTNITLPDTMHTIGNGAFFSCTSFNSIEFPEYLIQIGQCAFVSTGFTEIEVPSTVQEIGYSAFGYTTDQQGQLVAMNSFIVKGLTGSIAQSYCGENEHVTFESTGDVADMTEATEATEAETDKNDDEGLKPGIIVGIAVAAVIIIIAAIIIINKIKNSKEISDEANSDSIAPENESEETNEE